MDRNRELERLLKEALEFLKRRTYFYNTQRRGSAAALVEKIEKALSN